MNAVYYTLSVAWKEIQLMLKERGSLAIFLLMPLLLGSVMGGINYAAWGQEAEASILLHVSLANLDADGGYAIEVVKAIQSIDELEVEVHSSAVEAEEQVAKGEAAAAIVIPASF